MPSKNPKTSRVITIRVTTGQLAQLASVLPPDISVSALARALFKAYLDGSLPPEFQAMLLDEVARTNVSVRNGQRQLIALRRKEPKNVREQLAPAISLRDKLFLSFGSRDSM